MGKEFREIEFILDNFGTTKGKTKTILKWKNNKVLEAKIEEFEHARQIILMFPERISEYCVDREQELRGELV